MNILSTAAILEKNRLSSSGAWLILLEMDFERFIPGLVVRCVLNNQNIQYQNHEYIAFPFTLDDITESSTGEIPAVPLKVSNIDRVLQSLIEPCGGCCGAPVNIKIVHSLHLDVINPEIELDFVVIETDADENWVTFTLSVDRRFYERRPERRIMKSFCPFVYAESESGYKECLIDERLKTAYPDYKDCPKTLSACGARIAKHNAMGYKHISYCCFGGEPNIPDGGSYYV